jgi:hypothetical protein
MKNEHPDPKRHLYVSVIKSIIRIFSYLSLALGNVGIAAIGLIAAEVFGILEELV